jgi:hypothetical protein
MSTQSIYVEAECLTNIRIGEREPPKGEQWDFYLFTHRGAPKGPFELVTVGGATQKERDAALRKFMAQRHVHEIPSKEPGRLREAGVEIPRTHKSKKGRLVDDVEPG